VTHGAAGERWLAAALTGLCLVVAAPSAMAQANWRTVAVPMYGPAAYARGEALFLDTRVRRFAAESERLTSAVAGYCNGTSAAGPSAAQAQWRAAVTAWDALSAMSTGPLIERRSARSIDFAPVRRELLRRAIVSAPATVDDLEQIGAPARGFAALEWLLWAEPAQPRSPACSYATLVAADIGREAAALAEAALRRVDERLDDEAASSRVAEAVNQWLGGVELLRWGSMRKPLEVAATGGQAPVFARAPSGQTAASWAARWGTLRDATVLGERPVPVPGEASVPFETLLRGRGRNDLADRLVAATARVDTAFETLSPQRADSVQVAAAALGELARLGQDELAPALAVRIGFSDADGD
jgi:predicted lipoprotein